MKDSRLAELARIALALPEARRKICGRHSQSPGVEALPFRRHPEWPLGHEGSHADWQECVDNFVEAFGRLLALPARSFAA